MNVGQRGEDEVCEHGIKASRVGSPAAERLKREVKRLKKEA